MQELPVSIQTELTKLLGALGGDGGYVTQILVWMGAARFCLKWVSEWIVTRLTSTFLRCSESPESRDSLLAVAQTRWYRTLVFLGDFLLSVKFPRKIDLVRMLEEKEKAKI